MVVSELDRSRDAYTPGSPTPKGGLPMLNQCPTFGDSRLPARFWDKVRVLDSGCWEWQAGKTEGYGRFHTTRYGRDGARYCRACDVGRPRSGGAKHRAKLLARILKGK